MISPEGVYLGFDSCYTSIQSGFEALEPDSFALMKTHVAVEKVHALSKHPVSVHDLASPKVDVLPYYLFILFI